MQRNFLMTRVITLVFLLVIFNSALPVKAKELVAVGTQFSRVFELTSEGEYVGLSVDVLTRLAHRNGDTIRFELYPWGRAQLMVELGRADILIGPYKNQKRASRMSFFKRPFYQDEMVFYRQAGSNVSWSGDFASLLGKRIAKVKNWAYGDKFMEQIAFLRVQDFTSLQGAIVRLSRGDLDLVATNVRNTKAILRTMKNRVFVEPIAPIIAIKNGYFSFAKTVSHKDIQLEYEKHFDAMIASGELAELGIKHGVNTP